MTIAIEMRRIMKVFDHIVANDKVDLVVKEGHIHALLGENGAGKTTLMKILFGEERPTEGNILIFEKPQIISSPADALRLSLGFIHQHFTLVNEFTIGQNFALGIEPRRGLAFTNYDEVDNRAREILNLLDMPLSLEARVGTFSVEEQQIIEIGKALYRGAKILILDEPTSVLTPQRIEKLLEILKVLRREGKTIILITHKLDEALSVADEITVLRKGRLVVTLPRDQVNREQLVRLMIGDEPLINIERSIGSKGDLVVQVKNLSIAPSGITLVNNVNFEIHRGDIFGLTGVGGNGQAELVEALAGLRSTSQGEIIFRGEGIIGWGIRKRRLNGVAYVPEDRLRRGSAVTLSVIDNLIMGHQFFPEFHQGPILKKKESENYSRNLIDKYDVVTSSLEINAGSLSGGNLQKLIIAREFSFEASFLIVAYPSQGIDIRTTQFVHAELLRKREEGCAILLVSGDMDEIFALSDRIGVMFSGELVATVEPERTNRFELGQYMLGIRKN